MSHVNKEQIAHYESKLQFEIDSADLQKIICKEKTVIVLDVRSQDAYQKEHIPNAINFPHKTITKETAATYLDFDILYITYCDGIGCNASTKGALKLAQLGYKVKELMGGIDWWKRDGFSTITLGSPLPTNTCGCN